MSHDAEADWASAELARLISDNPSFCFSSDTSNIEISSFAGREGVSITTREKQLWKRCQEALSLS